MLQAVKSWKMCTISCSFKLSINRYNCAVVSFTIEDTDTICKGTYVFSFSVFPPLLQVAKWRDRGLGFSASRNLSEGNSPIRHHRTTEPVDYKSRCKKQMFHFDLKEQKQQHAFIFLYLISNYLIITTERRYYTNSTQIVEVKFPLQNIAINDS